MQPLRSLPWFYFGDISEKVRRIASRAVAKQRIRRVTDVDMMASELPRTLAGCSGEGGQTSRVSDVRGAAPLPEELVILAMDEYRRAAIVFANRWAIVL